MLHRNVVNDRVESANQNGGMRRVPRWRRLAIPILSVLAMAAGALALFFIDDNSTKKKTQNSKTKISKTRSSKKTRSTKRKQLDSDESSDEEF